MRVRESERERGRERETERERESTRFPGACRVARSIRQWI
jgi:hypothetical protein